MPRKDPHLEYRTRLNELLKHPEIKERFQELETLTINAIIKANHRQDILELVRHLKIIRLFHSGVASAPQINELREAGYKARSAAD